jgi:hypothetical protein
VAGRRPRRLRSATNSAAVSGSAGSLTSDPIGEGRKIAPVGSWLRRAAARSSAIAAWVRGQNRERLFFFEQRFGRELHVGGLESGVILTSGKWLFSNTTRYLQRTILQHRTTS